MWTEHHSIKLIGKTETFKLVMWKVFHVGRTLMKHNYCCLSVPGTMRMLYQRWSQLGNCCDSTNLCVEWGLRFLWQWSMRKVEQWEIALRILCMPFLLIFFSPNVFLFIEENLYQLSDYSFSKYPNISHYFHPKRN